MGYYASGYGDFKATVKENQELIDNVLDRLENNGGEEIIIDFGYTKGKISIQHCYGRYYDEDYCNIMSELAELGVVGEMEFNGEEDCHWKFVLKDGKAYICDGRVVFDEPSINNEIGGQ